MREELIAILETLITDLKNPPLSGPAAALAVNTGPVHPRPRPLELPAMQIHDTEQFTLSVQATDSKGFPVTDTLTWTVNNTDVATLAVSSDTMSATVIAGRPGSAVVTLSDGNLSATEAVDVIPGAASKLVITEGPASPQA